MLPTRHVNDIITAVKRSTLLSRKYFYLQRQLVKVAEFWGTMCAKLKKLSKVNLKVEITTLHRSPVDCKYLLTFDTLSG